MWRADADVWRWTPYADVSTSEHITDGPTRMQIRGPDHLMPSITLARVVLGVPDPSAVVSAQVPRV